MLMAPRTCAKRPVVARPSRAEHRPDHLEVVTERGHPLADGREAVAVRPPLLFLPAGADPELEAAAADDVDRRRQLGGQRRVAEPGAHHHVAEADPLGRHRQGGQDGERLEGDLVGRVRHGVEVIEDPQRFEAERLGVPGELHRAGPGVGRVPAVVFALPALRRHQANLHADLLGTSNGDAFARLTPRGASRDADRPVAAPRRRPILRSCEGATDADRNPASIRPPRCRARPTRGPTPASRAFAPGPPYHMTEMIDAEPALAGRLLRRGPGVERGGLAGGRDPRRGRPPASRCVVTGCGTSEHGAQGVGRDPARGAAGAPGSRAPSSGPTRRSRSRSTRRRAAW